MLNPVEPPMIMRNTVFCAHPGRGRRARPAAGPVTASIEAMVDDGARRTCPATRCGPSRSTTRRADSWRGMARVGVFLEVRGRGDYLPAYAGNLDIMTAAAARVGELLGPHLRRERRMTSTCSRARRHGLQVRLTDSTLRDGSPRDGAPVHRGAGPRRRARPGRAPASR